MLCSEAYSWLLQCLAPKPEIWNSKPEIRNLMLYSDPLFLAPAVAKFEAARNPRHERPNQKPETRDPRLETRNASPETQNIGTRECSHGSAAAHRSQR
jgi:hypothetical protein